MVGPLTAKALRALDDPAALAAAAVAAGPADAPTAVRTFAGPVVELAPDGRLGKREPAPVWLLRARVHSPVARDVALLTGAVGLARLAVGAATVLETRGEDRLLRDAERVLVHLDAGWNDLTVRLEKLSPYAVQFVLRVRDPDGLPLADLGWDVPAAPKGAAGPTSWCDAYNASLSFEAVDHGFVVHGTSAPVGLLPTSSRAPVLGLRLGEEMLAQAPLDLVALGRGAGSAVSAPIVRKADRVDVALLIDGQPCATRTLLLRYGLAGELVAAEAALAELAPRLSGPTADSLAYLAERSRARLEASFSQTRVLSDDLAALTHHLAEARAGRDPYATLTGVVPRAYRSRLDGSLQPYLLLVPPSYVRRAPSGFPLVLAAHGLYYDPADMARIVTGHPTGPGAAAARGLADGFAFDDLGALIAVPDGHDNAGHRPPGERDLLRVLEEVQRAYDVDPRAVSLTGFSLGGSVAFWQALRFADRFAATAPLCGYPNLTEYRSVLSVKRRRPWEARLLASEGIVEYAANGRYLPLRIVHGALDRPERSAVVVDRYKALKYRNFDFEVLAGKGHNVWDDAYADGTLVRWLAKQRRPAPPARPHLRTARYRWSKVDWLRLDRFARYGDFGELEGRLERRRLEVTTKNVAAFTLLAAPLAPAEPGPRELVVDRQSLGAHPLTADVSLRRGADGHWAIVAFPDVPAERKRAGVEGPLRDVWYDPLVVVYGTADPRQAEANRVTAEDLARYSPWITDTAPVLRDVDATPADLRGRHVVLIGNPASNTVTRGVADRLPVRFEPDALVFAGTRYPGPDVGIATVWPSPFDPDRTLVLLAGVGAAGTLSTRYLPELAPDWLIFDGRVRARWWDYLLGPRDVLAGGFYDEAWQP